MAESKSNAKNCTDEVNPTVFHDFFGRSCALSPAAVKPAASPAASASVGPISATSDLGSGQCAFSCLQVSFLSPYCNCFLFVC